MTQEKAIERNHSLKITSGETANEKDAGNVGKFVMTNGVTGKEHELAMWGFTMPDEGAVATVDVYTSMPEELTRGTGNIESYAFDSLRWNSLEELITTEEKVWPDIEKYAFNPDVQYEYDIPLTDIRMDLHDLIVKEEIADLIIMKEKNVLTKEDVLDFGKLVKGDDTRYDLGTTLKEPIQNILKENRFDAEELAAMTDAAKKLNAEIDFNSQEIAKEKSQKIKVPAKEGVEHSI